MLFWNSLSQSKRCSHLLYTYQHLLPSTTDITYEDLKAYNSQPGDIHPNTKALILAAIRISIPTNDPSASRGKVDNINECPIEGRTGGIPAQAEVKSDQIGTTSNTTGTTPNATSTTSSHPSGTTSTPNATSSTHNVTGTTSSYSSGTTSTPNATSTTPNATGTTSSHAIQSYTDKVYIMRNPLQNKIYDYIETFGEMGVKKTILAVIIISYYVT